MEGTPDQKICVPRCIVDQRRQVPPLGGGLALFAMRLPLLDGRPKSGLRDAVTKCGHLEILLRAYVSQMQVPQTGNGSPSPAWGFMRSEEHTSELQSPDH